MRCHMRRTWYLFCVALIVTALSVVFWLQETSGRSKLELFESQQEPRSESDRDVFETGKKPDLTEAQQDQGKTEIDNLDASSSGPKHQDPEAASTKWDLIGVEDKQKPAESETSEGDFNVEIDLTRILEKSNTSAMEDDLSSNDTGILIVDDLKASNISIAEDKVGLKDNNDSEINSSTDNNNNNNNNNNSDNINNTTTTNKIANTSATEDDPEPTFQPPSKARSLDFLHRFGLNASNDTPDPNPDPKLKTILLWTWLYSKPDWVFGLGQKPFLENCPAYNNCRTTLDHRQIDSADAVMFFVFAMTTMLVKTERLSEMLPPRGHQDQVYVFWNDEPPRPAFGPFGTLKGLRGVFNATVTYRDDSTITLPIFRVGKRYAPTPPLNGSAIMANKTKLACWVVSACGKSHSHRFEYAEALARHIPIDIYGKCGNFTCPGDGFECFNVLQRSYKFYFAFENSYCRDYITEKAYRTLQGNWVPIVLGGGNYTDRLPPKSFIDVRDYPSPKHLADYLRFLDENDEEYLKYLEYKRFYRINRRQTKTAFCKLCEMLNKDDPGSYETDLDPHEWWEESGCIKKYYVPRTIHLTEK